MADGFDDNDLRLLARRAAAVKEALRALNQPPPFNEARLVAYLDLLEATPEPKDGEVVLAAVLQARSVIRATHADNLGTDKEPEATAVDRELAALYGDLTIVLAPFANQTRHEEQEGPIVEAGENELQVEQMRAGQRDLRATLQEAIQEFLESPFRMGVSASVLASVIDPLVLAGFVALFVVARLSEGRISQWAVERLLGQQENQISAFERAVERNRQAVETVSGLYNRTKTVTANARTKIATVRRGVSRIFGKAEPLPEATQEPPLPAFPEASPEDVRDLPPSDLPTPDLPPPDCTTDDGQPGYLIAGTCYPPDTTELRLDGKEDIDFAKLAAFRQLTLLDLNNTPVSDLTPVAGLSGLQTLSLGNTQVSDLTPVAGLSGLQTLSLGNTQVSDLTPVAGLSGLQTLRLDNTQVSDLTPLKRLEKLRLLVLPDGRELGGLRVNEENRREVQRFLARL